MDQDQQALPPKILSKDEILLLSLKLFAQKGFFNTSLTDIKEAADIKTSNGIYQHFKNKQTIAAELYGNIMDSLNISIDDIRRRNRKPSEQLRETVNLFFKLTEDAPDVMRFLLLLKLNEFLPDEKPLLETPAFIKIKKIFFVAAKEGEIRNMDATLAYSYFFGIINTLLSMVLSGELEKPASSYQAQAWTTAWATIVKK
ncbi:MAG: TetR/AcrR family transcriptional regulator [Methylococcales bacterium]|nr:TetR/AcrR family transcriptional regulator [Methylococcales bacterium]